MQATDIYWFQYIFGSLENVPYGNFHNLGCWGDHYSSPEHTISNPNSSPLVFSVSYSWLASGAGTPKFYSFE